MQRVPFAIVDTHLKQYLSEMVEKLGDGFPCEEYGNAASEYMRTYVEATGWTIEDYTATLMGWDTSTFN